MENVSSSRSRSLGRQHGSSSTERQRVPSAERQRAPSSERQRAPSAERHRVQSSSSDRDRHHNERSHEKQRGSLYSGGMAASPCATKSGNPVSALFQQACVGEQDLSISQGQESSRRYAAFLRQDGLLHSDIDNFNTNYNVEKSSSQNSVRLESPNDEIAPERLGIQKRRPATTPAALFHLPTSKSHPGPGIACNFDINMGTQADLSKLSTTSIDDEVVVFQNGLNDVTHQLELIQETQGTILTELANDIEALQSENTYLRESRNRLQSANDNLLKVVQDLTKELALKKGLEPHLSSSSKSLTKSPKDILKGLETILNASHTNLDQKEQREVSKGHGHGQDATGVSNDSNKLKSRHSTGKKSANSKTSYSRGDVPRPKTRSSPHVEDPRRTSSARQSKTQNYSVNDEEEKEPQTSSSVSRRHQSRLDRRQNDSEDSDSDEYYSDKNEQKKKKKNGCFSFGRKRNSNDRDRDRNRHR